MKYCQWSISGIVSFFLSVTGLAQVTSAPAGSCVLKIKSVNFVTGDAYRANVLGLTSETEKNLSVTLENTGGAPCTYTLGVRSTNTPPAEPQRYLKNPDKDVSETRLKYKIFSPANTAVQDIAATGVTAADFVTGTLAQNTPVVIQLKVRIDKSQLVPCSTRPYQDTLTLQAFDQVYSPALATATPTAQSAPVPLMVEINPELEISFSDYNTAAIGTLQRDPMTTLDFGPNMQKGTQQHVMLNIVSNNGYELSFVSEHQGKLEHVGKKGINAQVASVPYTLMIDSTIPYPLESSGGSSPASNNSIKVDPNTLVDARVPTPLSRRQITITLGDTEHALAGDYRDVITVTVQHP